LVQHKLLPEACFSSEIYSIVGFNLCLIIFLLANQTLMKGDISQFPPDAIPKSRNTP
jgi:hypothetical protein